MKLSLATSLLFFLAAAEARAEVQSRPLLVFSGNVALTEEVYRAVLNLRPGTTATSSTADSVRLHLLEFLHRAGYDLAAVRTRAKDGQIFVDLNEGRLDKVLFLNENAYEQIRLRLTFGLPQNVFNRLILERQLHEMSLHFGIVDAHWMLVPTEKPDHVGFQIESLKPIPNLDLIPPESGYELRIELKRSEWDSGVGLDASVNGLEGVGVGAHYRDHDLLLEDDRWEARGRIAGNLRETIVTQETRPVLSAGLIEGRWFTPPLVGKYFRTYLNFSAYFINRQRRDLNLEAFNYAPIEASVRAEYAFLRELSLSIGAGVEHWQLFGIETTVGSPPNAFVDRTPSRQTRVFAVGHLDVLFNPDEIRRDRKHTIELEARSYQRSDNGESLRKASLGYQKDFVFGWHEVWVRSRGTILWGTVLYPDEEAMGGDYLRGPFSGAFYLRKVAGLSGEVRFSLVRDLFKLSVFHDFAVFGAQNSDRTTESLAAANAFGGGMHVLIIDAFQLDAYFGVGFATDGTFDKGLNIAFRQAY